MSTINKDYPRGAANLWLERRRTVPEDAPRFARNNDGVEYQPYDFTVSYPDVRSLLMAIQLLGEDIVGAEVGLYRGESFCTILQVCKNVKTLYGIDPWTMYHDTIGGSDGMRISPKEIDLVREMCLHYVTWSGEQDRAEIIETDSAKGAEMFDEGSLDFVFIDSYISREDVVEHMSDWYSKVKTGGLFCGHDYGCAPVFEGVEQFRQLYGITTPISHYDDCWAWIKQQGEDNATE